MKRAIVYSLAVYAVFFLVLVNEGAVRAVAAVLLLIVFAALVPAVGLWLWEEYGPAARRRRRGAERIVGPEGRRRVGSTVHPTAPPARRLTFGPAFRLTQSRSRRRR